MSAQIERLLDRLEDVRKHGSGAKAKCPVSGCSYRVSVSLGDDGIVLIAGDCGHHAADVVAAVGLTLRDLFPVEGREGVHVSPSTPQQSNTPQPQQAGLTLAEYAVAKQLDPERLRAFGLSDVHYNGRPVLRMAYLDETGGEIAARFRLRLEKGEDDDRFRWKKESKAVPYGQNRLMIARESGYIVVVEGESDCHTLWSYGEPALGIPGAGCWRDDRDAALLDGIDTIYVFREPDAAAAVMVERFGASQLRDRVRVFSPQGFKDASELHCADPVAFRARWEAAKADSVAINELLADQAKADADAAWAACQSLAATPDLLSAAASMVARLGVAGEEIAVKIVYLALVSRLLPRPVSVALKGPSSVGKSYTVEQVLRLFPSEAFYCLTAMSERALAYSEESLRHKMLVIYEAAGMSGDMASYLIRSLLSEGRLDYETVEKTRDGLKAKRITREGPTGLIITTTAVSLHPENETRLISIPVTDSKDQTRAVLRALANGHGPVPDLRPWHELQRWLAGGPCQVQIPFANILARLTPPAAVRLRRDFGAVLTLVRAHALLHRATRDLDDEGRIVATLDDYGAVRALLEPLIAAGVGSTVAETVRETVDAVAVLLAKKEQNETVSITQIAKQLNLDKAPVSRRVRAATDRGYLVNHEDRKGRPAKIAIGEALPEDEPILPECCAVAVLMAGDNDPSPPPEEDPFAGSMWEDEDETDPVKEYTGWEDES